MTTILSPKVSGVITSTRHVVALAYPIIFVQDEHQVWADHISIEVWADVTIASVEGRILRKATGTAGVRRKTLSWVLRGPVRHRRVPAAVSHAAVHVGVPL